MISVSRHAFSFGFSTISLLGLSQSEEQGPFHEILSPNTSSQATALRKWHVVSDLSWNRGLSFVFDCLLRDMLFSFGFCSI